MKFTTKTEYGLVCFIYMSRHIDKETIPIKELAQQEKFSIPYLEKILQSLRAAGIVNSHHGKQGGYHLARHPSRIALKEIIEALEGGSTFDIPTFGVFCEPVIRKNIVCTHFSMCGLRPVWNKTKELLDTFYGSVTLETIAKEEREVKNLVGTPSNS